MASLTITATVTDSLGATATTTVTASQGVTWPSAATTGYGSTVLTPATSNSISAPGTYSGLHFSTGTVTIKASNVTLIDCLFTANASDQWSVGIGAGFTGVLIKNCEFAGAGSAGVQGSYCVYVQGNSAVTIDSCNIHGYGQPVVMNDGQVVLQNSYVWNLSAGSGTHYECVGYFGDAKSGAFSLLVQNNNLQNQNNQTAVFYSQNYFGALNNITVTNNLMVGGDYTVYVDGKATTNPVTNVSITNNALGAGIFGYSYPGKGSGTYQVMWSGNYDYKTGATVPGP